MERYTQFTSFDIVIVVVIIIIIIAVFKSNRWGWKTLDGQGGIKEKEYP